MQCPKCRIEMRQKQTEDGKVQYICRSKNCGNYGKIVAEK